MKYAVEARIFDNGRIVSKVRPAKEGETRACDVWVDVFDSETEARQFCRDYKRA